MRAFHGTRHRLRQVLALLMLIGLILAPWFLPSYRVFQLNLMLCTAMALIGLNLLTGWSGQISLGHGALFALGAYGSGLLMNHLAIPWAWTLPCAAALGWGLGYLMGLPARRLGGHELALATFALALAVPQVLKHPFVIHWTGGTQGMTVNRPAIDVLAGRAHLSPDQTLYLMVLALTGLIYWFAHRSLHAGLGCHWRALRDHPIAAQAIGLDPAGYKPLAFAYSAGISGVAGACHAAVVGFIAPDSFPPMLSLILLVGVVVGGLGWLPGALIGAAFIQFVPHLTDSISLSAPWALYGLTLIGVLVWMPAGAAGLGALQRQPRRPEIAAPHERIP